MAQYEVEADDMKKILQETYPSYHTIEISKPPGEDFISRLNHNKFKKKSSVKLRNPLLSQSLTFDKQ